MKKPLLGKKVAVLVANGFREKDLTSTQKIMMNAGATLRIISMDQGLVNSWNNDEGEERWGLNFAVDQTLNKALAADYDMLIVPGGRRSIEKLELTAHTRRFIGGFVDTGKPVAIYDNALELLVFAERAAGVGVAGPESLRQSVEQQGAIWSDEPCIISDNIITGLSNADTRKSYALAVSEFFVTKGTEAGVSQVAEEALPHVVAA